MKPSLHQQQHQHSTHIIQYIFDYDSQLCFVLIVSMNFQVTEHHHLKYYISVAGPDLLCVSSSKESQEILHRIEREATFSYQTLTLSEESAANVLYINGTLIHRSIQEAPVSSQVRSTHKASTMRHHFINLMHDFLISTDFIGEN